MSHSGRRPSQQIVSRTYLISSVPRRGGKIERCRSWSSSPPTMSSETKIMLTEAEIPRRWYNIVADLPSPPPPVLHPGTHQPVGPDDLAPLFPMSLIEQEV